VAKLKLLTPMKERKTTALDAGCHLEKLFMPGDTPFTCATCERYGDDVTFDTAEAFAAHLKEHPLDPVDFPEADPNNWVCPVCETMANNGLMEEPFIIAKSKGTLIDEHFRSRYEGATLQ
jgi:hypothetical protein